MKVLELCAGYGGLAMALGYTPFAVAENDLQPSRVLKERFPDAPNYGDIRDVPTGLEADVITAGFPCQPVSIAGRKRGHEDDRWIFDDILKVVGRMGNRPRLFLENVQGILSANSGDAMARVVHGLASMGYVGRWGLVRAADVGACHRRTRWFCVASHPDSPRLEGQEHQGRRYVPSGDDLLPTPTSTYPGGSIEQYRERLASYNRNSTFMSLNHLVESFDKQDWGVYTSAIERHAKVVGRQPPPSLTDAGTLSDRFVEWMMMLPDGWVTGDDIPVIGRKARLKILGNGVVPLQARLAWNLLQHHTEDCATTL